MLKVMCVADKRCVVVVFDQRQFLKFLEERPRLTCHILKIDDYLREYARRYPSIRSPDPKIDVLCVVCGDYITCQLQYFPLSRS